MLGKTISQSGKTSDVRYITLSYEGSQRGMDGIAHHARSGSPINLRPTGRAAGIPTRLPWAGQAYVSTLNYAFSVRQTSDKSTLERPAAAHRPLHEHGICELLGHGADQHSHTSRPEAKNTHRSKLPVAGHDLWPHQ